MNRLEAWTRYSEPRVRMRVCGCYENSADERLTYLSQRPYSSQWEIPEDVNAKVVNELKRQFAGIMLPQELRILVWDINDLKAYCRTHTS